MRYSLIIFILVFAGTERSIAQAKAGKELPKQVTETVVFQPEDDLMMNEHRFWGIISEAKAQSGGVYKYEINGLKRLLFTLRDEEIEQFDNRFTDIMERSYDARLWGAAYVINGGCSDDCFDSFRQYLIAQGKEKFYATLKDPETCISWIKSDQQERWDGFQYAAADVYKKKTGKNIPRTYQPEFELKGEWFDEETVAQQYPRLAKKFKTM
jgi:hypothetical protein